MNEVGFRREIFDFLKTGYGITDAAVEGGGKHHALVFTKPNGPRIKTTWPRQPVGGQDWSTTLKIKTKDLVSMLGDPAPPPERPRAKMEDLMPAPATPIADQIRGALPSLAAQLDERPAELPATTIAPERVVLRGWTVAGYLQKKGGFYLRVYFPRTERDRIGSGATVTETSPGVWQLTPASDDYRVRDYGSDQMLLQWSVARMTPFSRTPCEVIAEDGTIIVRLPTPDARAPLVHHHRAVSIAQPATPVASPRPSSDSAPTPDDIRVTLAMIRRVEAETPYRLIRDGENWVFDPGLARIV